MGLEDTRVAADRDHFSDLQGSRATNRRSEDEPAAGRIANEQRSADAQRIEKSLQVFNSQARGVGKAIKLVRELPAEQVGGDDVKRFGVALDIGAPCNLCRCAILAAVEQYKIGSAAAGFQKMCLDVASDDGAMVIGG